MCIHFIFDNFPIANQILYLYVCTTLFVSEYQSQETSI